VPVTGSLLRRRLSRSYQSNTGSTLLQILEKILVHVLKQQLLYLPFCKLYTSDCYSFILHIFPLFFFI